jgi:5-methylcytosine-specific restriction endonuclease McrA
MSSDEDAAARGGNARRHTIVRQNVAHLRGTLNAAQDAMCALCGAALDDEAQVDHVIELALLGDLWRHVKSAGRPADWHPEVARAVTGLVNSRANLRLLCRASHDRKR